MLGRSRGRNQNVSLTFNSGKVDFSKLNEMTAIHKKYDEKVVQELDANQQAKYADLKKQGKLPALGGGNVRFQFSSSDGK